MKHWGFQLSGARIDGSVVRSFSERWLSTFPSSSRTESQKTTKSLPTTWPRPIFAAPVLVAQESSPCSTAESVSDLLGSQEKLHSGRRPKWWSLPLKTARLRPLDDLISASILGTYRRMRWLWWLNSHKYKWCYIKSNTLRSSNVTCWKIHQLSIDDFPLQTLVNGDLTACHIWLPEGVQGVRGLIFIPLTWYWTWKVQSAGHLQEIEVNNNQILSNKFTWKVRVSEGVPVQDIMYI